VQPILELGILEADCQLSRCFDFSMDEKGEVSEGSESKSRTYITTLLLDLIGRGKFRFVGTLTIKFRARYGVDMETLQIRVDDEAKIVYVEGAEPSYLGIKGFPESSWESCVTLRERSYGEWATDDIASGLEAPFKDACRESVEESLKNGPEELDWLKHPLQNTVKHLLRMMIAPPGYAVEFVDEADARFVPFFEYTTEIGIDKPRLGSGLD